MQIWFDKYKQPTPPKVYLGSANNKPICPITGIEEDTFDLVRNVNNTYEVSFTLDRFIEIDGIQVETNCYDLVDTLMRLYVEGVGWFIIQPPSSSNDGNKECKNVIAESAEIEMQQHDIESLKINCGTTDSYEMLIESNVEIIDEVEFAKEQIKFCNKENVQLSFLHILMKVSGLHGWSIGYVDEIPKRYEYYEDGEIKYKYVTLSDEIGTFSVDKQDLYSFLTQTVSQFFSCIFVFDFKNFIINVYRPENYGKNTNINIGFRNLQNSNEVAVDENNLFTRYRVYGSDDLSITYVNFGLNIVEDLSYFLNEKYMSRELIDKYRLWESDRELRRPQYIENTKLYNEQLKVVSELYDRVPLDDCSTDWSTFSDDELLEAQSNYEAQLKGYESFYVDENGEFDQDALDASTDAKDYYQIKDVILPSIQIEMDNRNLSEDEEPKEYINTYETDWDLYGLDELQVRLDMYKNDVAVCQKGGYDVPYSEDSGHTEDYHNKMYQRYLDAADQLDGAKPDSCQSAYDERAQEIEDAEAVAEQYDDARKEIMENAEKETWEHDGIAFTEDDLALLSKYYIDTDYTNGNMFLTSSDDAVTAIDEQLKLYDAAVEDLSIYSQPQYIYTTTLENFLTQYEYRNYTNNLEMGDFIWLGVRDDYVVKLRVMSLNHNPLTMGNDLQITFSNMLKSKSSRDDFTYLLGSVSNRGKNSVSGGSGSSLTNEGVTITPGLLQKIVSSATFNQAVEDSIVANGGGGSSGSITTAELDAKLKKVIDLDTGDGSFNYLQAKLISTDKIIADSGEFGDLKAKVAQIDTLLSGSMSAELGHIINLTADNVTIDEAVIRDIIASQITVSMLEASEINTDKFNIASEDGGLVIVGNTMQFYDKNGNIRIQIGRDANDDFTFSLYNAEGTGVLIDENGIHESAIDDGLIKNDMLAGGITKDKLGFNIIEADENGNVDAAVIKINGEGLDVKYTTIERNISNLNQKIEDNIQFRLELFSSDGIIFTNGVIDTYIQVTLYKGNDDVTTDYEDSCFVWSKQSSDADLDDYWNSQHQTGTKTLHITNEDVYRRAQFRCDFVLNDAVVATASI